MPHIVYAIFLLSFHISAIAVLLLFTWRLWSNVSFWRFAKHSASSKQPQVSVLVPARNEEQSITACVESLLRQDYPFFEVYVLDDCSTDRTGALLDNMAAQNQKLHVIHQTQEPPEGWVGKVYACHQLAQHAPGEWLLFTDADTIHSPKSLSLGMASGQKLQVSCISALPFQQTKTWSERLFVPFILHILPIFGWDFRAQWQNKGNSIANGQYMLVNAKEYQQIGGHAAIRHALLDDFALVQQFQLHGYSTALCNGAEWLQCRMYHNAREVWNGFAKNIMLGLNNSGSEKRPAGFAALFSWGYASVFVMPWLLLFTLQWTAFIEIIWILALYTFAAVQYKRQLAEILIFPISALSILILGLYAILRQRQMKAIYWKGRAYASNVLDEM